MTIRTSLAAGIASLALLGGCQAMTPPPPATPSSTAAGPALVDSRGMTLYTFDRDQTPGKSVCNGPCAVNWPPLPVTSNAKPSGDWSLVTRDDGSLQWAYKGKPLYTWIKDMKPGDATGDGFNNNTWHVARP